MYFTFFGWLFIYLGFSHVLFVAALCLATFAWLRLVTSRTFRGWDLPLNGGPLGCLGEWWWGGKLFLVRNAAVVVHRVANQDIYNR